MIDAVTEYLESMLQTGKIKNIHLFVYLRRWGSRQASNGLNASGYKIAAKGEYNLD